MATPRLLSLVAAAIGTSFLVAGPVVADKWTAKALNIVTDTEDQVEESEIPLVGKLVERDDKDSDGNPISRAFLEQEVKILGTAQSLQGKAKRYRRLMKITGISPLG